MSNLKVWKFQYPYPINDWRDKEAYKIKRTPKEWAWEFLRRNKYYQYDYDRYIYHQEFPEYEIIIKDELSLERQKKDIDSMRLFGIDTDDNINDFVVSSNERALSFRLVKNDEYENPLKDVILEKYKLFNGHSFLNPKEALPQNNFFDADRDGVVTLYFNPSPNGERRSIAPIKPEHIVFRLNARVSPTKQLAHITQCLKNTKKHLKIPKLPSKPSDTAMTHYIRALDANASSDVDILPIKEIVNEIHDKGDSTQSPSKYFYKDWLPPALELSEKNYFYLFDK